MSQTSNDTLRKSLRKKRNALAPDFQNKAAHAAWMHLKDKDLFKQSTHIGCYLSQEGELNPAPFISAAFDLQKKIYLPAIHPGKPNEMRFLRHLNDDPLIKNKFDIPEPDAHCSAIQPWDLDLIIVPTVGFDRQGNRIGRGAGYYDRCLSFIFELPKNKHPTLIGYAYSMQEVAQLDNKAWDVPMDYIITEKEFIIASKS